MAAGGRHGAGAVAESLYSYIQAEDRERLTSNGMGLETSKLTPRDRNTS